MYYLKRIVQSIQMREPHRSLEDVSVLIDVPLITLKEVMAQGDQFEPVMQSEDRVHRRRGSINDRAVIVDEISAIDTKTLNAVRAKGEAIRRSAEIPSEATQKLLASHGVVSVKELYAKLYGASDGTMMRMHGWEPEIAKKAGVAEAKDWPMTNPCAEITLPQAESITTLVKLAYIRVNKNSPVHQECLNDLRQHIPRYGILKPVHLLQRGKEYLCIDGKHRLMAAMSVGIEEVRCIVARRDYSALGIEFISIHEALNSKVVHVDAEGCDGKIRAMFPAKEEHQLVEMDFKNLDGTHFIQVSGDRNAAPVFKDEMGRKPCSCPKRQVLDSGCTCGGY